MKLRGFAALVLLGALAMGQDAAPAPGFPVPAVLDKGLDSKKVKEGDPVVAKLGFDLSSGGNVVLAKDSQLLGHVTKATARGKGDADSTLAFVFERAVAKNGKTFELTASVQALAPPRRTLTSGPPDDRFGNPTGGGQSGSDAGGLTNPAPGQTTPGFGTNDQPAPASAAGPALHADSKGPLGMKGTTMDHNAVISSDGKSVKLEGGTQMILRLTAFKEAGAVPAK